MAVQNGVMYMAAFPRDCEDFCKDLLTYVTHLTQILRMCHVDGTELKEGRERRQRERHRDVKVARPEPQT